MTNDAEFKRALGDICSLIVSVGLVREGLKFIAGPINKSIIAKEVEDSVNVAAIAIEAYCSTLDETEGEECSFIASLRQKLQSPPFCDRANLVDNATKVIQQSQRIKLALYDMERNVKSIFALRLNTNDKNPSLAKYEQGSVESRLALAQANLVKTMAVNADWFYRYLRLANGIDPRLDTLLAYEVISTAMV